jgi:long-chain acyl-CoA synthetase
MSVPTTRDAVFVTGATGLLGGLVVRRLLAARPERRVYALARDPARLPSLTGLVPVRGDVTLPALGIAAADRARLAGEVRGVVHLAADTTFSRPLPESRAVNRDGTRRLLELADDWPRLARVAYVSTAFVAGRRTGLVPECAASDDAGWVNAYEQAKAEAERCVREWRGEWTIVRPSTVVCDDEGGAVTQQNAVHRALRLCHAGLAAMMPSGEGSALDVVTADYVADAIAALAFDPALAGATAHLCAGERAMPLVELLDVTYALWARDPAWRRRDIARPVLVDAATYALFERAVEETGDARLRRVTRSLSHFIPQLALPKRFDTVVADRALGRPAPAPRDYWPRLVRRLLDDWSASSVAPLPREAA